jgi:hypothetical protein
MVKQLTRDQKFEGSNPGAVGTRRILRTEIEITFF